MTPRKAFGHALLIHILNHFSNQQSLVFCHHYLVLCYVVVYRVINMDWLFFQTVIVAFFYISISGFFGVPVIRKNQHFLIHEQNTHTHNNCLEQDKSILITLYLVNRWFFCYLTTPEVNRLDLSSLKTHRFPVGGPAECFPICKRTCSTKKNILMVVLKKYGLLKQKCPLFLSSSLCKEQIQYLSLHLLEQ